MTFMPLIPIHAGSCVQPGLSLSLYVEENHRVDYVLGRVYRTAPNRSCDDFKSQSEAGRAVSHLEVL